MTPDLGEESDTALFNTAIVSPCHLSGGHGYAATKEGQIAGGGGRWWYDEPGGEGVGSNVI